MLCPEATALILIATAPFAGRRVRRNGNGACFLSKKIYRLILRPQKLDGKIRQGRVSYTHYHILRCEFKKTELDYWFAYQKWTQEWVLNGALCPYHA